MKSMRLCWLNTRENEGDLVNPKRFKRWNSNPKFMLDILFCMILSSFKYALSTYNWVRENNHFNVDSLLIWPNVDCKRVCTKVFNNYANCVVLCTSTVFAFVHLTKFKICRNRFNFWYIPFMTKNGQKVYFINQEYLAYFKQWMLIFFPFAQ